MVLSERDVTNTIERVTSSHDWAVIDEDARWTTLTTAEVSYKVQVATQHNAVAIHRKSDGRSIVMRPGSELAAIELVKRLVTAPDKAVKMMEDGKDVFEIEVGK